MQILAPSLLLAVFSETAFSSPLHSRHSYAVKDSHNVPRTWSRVGPAPSAHRITLQIGLKQSQFDELERQLYQGQELVTMLKYTC